MKSARPFSPIRFPIFALALSLLGLGAAGAKSADDYLHGGAAKYIQGRLQDAGVEVEEGLREYPDDSRLKALAGQLKNMKNQQKKDQGGQGSQGGDQNKDKQDKRDSSGQNGQEGKQDGQDRKDQDKQKQEEKKQQPEDKDQGGAAEDRKPQPEPGKEGDSSGQAAAPAKPGQMSKDEAERLLNSYQDDEKREQKQMQKRNRRPVEVEEDW
jgi:hypothetical protein